MNLFRLRSNKYRPRTRKTVTRKRLSRFVKELEEIPEEDQDLSSTFEFSSDDDDDDDDDDDEEEDDESSSSLDRCKSYLPNHYSTLLSIQRVSSWDDDDDDDNDDSPSDEYDDDSSESYYDEKCSVPVPQAVTSPQSNNNNKEDGQDDYIFLNEFKEETKVEYDITHKIPTPPSIKEYLEGLTTSFEDEENKDDESLIVFDSDASIAEEEEEESEDENDPSNKYETRKVHWNAYSRDDDTSTLLSPNTFYYSGSSSSRAEEDNSLLEEEESRTTTRRNNCTSKPKGYNTNFFSSKQYYAYATQSMTNTWIIDMADRMLDFLICK